jgi:ankyrin repeat protein
MRQRRTLIISLAVVTLLSVGCGKSAADARRKLSEKGLALSNEGLVKSVRDGDLETATLFLDAGLSPETKDGNGVTVLMDAAITNDVAIARVLISRGANVNARTNEGETALMYAALMGRTEAASVLIEAGAALDAKDNRGETPLAHARSHTHTGVINLLKAAGAKE